MRIAQTILVLIDVVIGAMFLGSILTVAITNLSLSKSFDPEKLSERLRDGLTGAANGLLAPVECFDEKVRWLWRVRYRALLTIATATLMFIALVMISTVLDIPIAPPK